MRSARNWTTTSCSAGSFFDEVVVQADGLGLLSDEHFTVDGTLIEAAAGLSFSRTKLSRAEVLGRITLDD